MKKSGYDLHHTGHVTKFKYEDHQGLYRSMSRVICLSFAIHRFSL